MSELVRSNRSELVCGNRFYNCICKEDAHEGDVHKCACGGSWEGDGQGDVEEVKILTFPESELFPNFVWDLEND